MAVCEVVLIKKERGDSMRVFLALPVGGYAADALHKWSYENRSKLAFRKWTHRLDYHITLQFLGETPDSRIKKLNDALMRVQAPPVTLSLSGGGTFGPKTAPRVLWSAVDGEMESLNALHRVIVQATGPLGYVPEDRPYTAHITLARSFKGNDVAFERETLTTVPSGLQWTADRFVLMRTHMHASSMYETIGEYPLFLT